MLEQMLEQMVEKVQAEYPFAKFLNYAYQIGNDLYGLVFTPDVKHSEIVGGSIIVINSSSLKSNIFPVRPQTMEALHSYGEVKKIFSVSDSLSLVNPKGHTTSLLKLKYADEATKARISALFGSNPDKALRSRSMAGAIIQTIMPHAFWLQPMNKAMTVRMGEPVQYKYKD